MASPFRWRTRPGRLVRRLSRNHPLGRVRYTPRGVNVEVVTATTHADPAHHRGAGRRLRRRGDGRRQHPRPVPRPGRRRRDRHQPRRSSDVVDIVLYDSFAQPESDHDEIGVLVGNPSARRVVVYTWNFHPDLVDSARQQGVQRLPVQGAAGPRAGRRPGGGPRRRGRDQRPPAGHGPINGLDWPGRGEGLTDRESEILALITQGLSNADVAALTYLSPNTVKSYIRTHLPQDRRRQPHPGRAVGRPPRLHPRPPPHRPLARRTLTAPTTTRRCRPGDHAVEPGHLTHIAQIRPDPGGAAHSRVARPSWQGSSGSGSVTATSRGFVRPTPRLATDTPDPAAGPPPRLHTSRESGITPCVGGAASSIRRRAMRAPQAKLNRDPPFHWLGCDRHSGHG